MQETLKSGRQVEIRPIEPGDAEAIAEAYEGLSPRTKYQRFLGPKQRLSSSDLRYLTEVDGDTHVALVATEAGEPQRILGVGRYVRLAEGSRVAEFAITICDDFQGEGLGSVIAERLAEIARERGIDRFTATVLAENIAIRKLMRRLSGALASERHFGPVDEIDIELAA